MWQFLFNLDSEADDEETVGQAEAFAAMSEEWMGLFKADDVANLVNHEQTNPHSAVLRDFLFGKVPVGFVTSPKSVGRFLKNHLDCPVRRGDLILTLRAKPNKKEGLLNYFVSVASDGE